MLKGALHIHTTCSDGDLTPLEVLRVYRDLGFDFVALTDHDFLMKPDAYADVPDDFEDMLVFKGIEQTVFARGYVHVSRIPGDREVLRILNHPAEYALAAEQVAGLIHEIEQSMQLKETRACDRIEARRFVAPICQSELVQDAPIGKSEQSRQIWTNSQTLNVPFTIDAVEVTVKGFYTPEYNVAAIALPKVASDDSHTREGCGRAWVEVECAKTKDAIIRAIGNGEARVCYTATAHRSAWSNPGGNGGG